MQGICGSTLRNWEQGRRKPEYQSEYYYKLQICFMKTGWKHQNQTPLT
jgi:hypothetical protein